ncbi:MAG TPA: SAM-dependent chlorinase/fluorinase [Bryobacteraceae bacterium]|nr:SAM-dependent chlorinase/fluorinase [Bryobacteraceae bacterium]
MPFPLVTVTTDFGTSDHYVGVMKGVILSRCPEARIVDISNEIPCFSLVAAAYSIEQAALYFPPGTIHLLVVDPGVGSSRRALLVEALHQFFVAPDNGCLSLILARDSRARVRQLTNPGLWLANPSSTFHGRDLFAPTAALLAARSILPEEVGDIVNDPVILPELQARQNTSRTWQGTVLSVDHFGNVISNFPAEPLREALLSGFALEGGAAPVRELRSSFAGAPPGLCFAYWGSSNYLEIGVNQASAAQVLALRPGNPLLLRLLG